jgi:nucleoid-associated protein YgaU
MPNDAKLGLVVGVGLVIAFAVLFFHKDPAVSSPQPEGAAAAVPIAPEARPARKADQPSRPQSAVRSSANPEANLRHTVKEGDTFLSLAGHYYGNVEKSLDIYRVNREVLKTPDRLAPGMALTIPDLPRRFETLETPPAE